VRGTDSRSAELHDLLRVRHHAVGHPRAVTQPTDLAQVLERPATEGCDGEIIVLGILRKMRVQAHVQRLGQFCRADHQPARHGEWTARREGNAHHRTVRTVMVPLDRGLGQREDFVVLLHHIVRR
jgi:hypothetical protein